MDLLLLNTVLQIIWYASVGIFFVYKYASQAHSILKFIWTMCKSVGWLAHKTLYFIRGSPREYEYEPLITETKPESKWKKLWNKTKTFFGFKQTNDLPNNNDNVYVTNVSNSNNGLGISSELEQSNSQNSMEQHIFNQRFQGLVQEDAIDRSKLYNYTDNIELQNSHSEICEPVTVASYHPVEQNNFFNTPRLPFTQNSMYYSIDLNQSTKSPRNI